MPHRLTKLLISLSLLLTGYSSQADEGLSGQPLIDALQQGGYSIYFRHEKTDWSQSDDYMDSNERFSCDPSKMRQLSAEGKQRARDTGSGMRNAGIPVNEVIASPYCRCVETARLMNLASVTPSNAVMNLRVADYYGGRQAIIESAQALLATPTQPGFNRVIVAHGNVAQAATPVYPGEGEAVVFKAVGNGKFEVVARIPHQVVDKVDKAVIRLTLIKRFRECLFPVCSILILISL